MRHHRPPGVKFRTTAPSGNMGMNLPDLAEPRSIRLTRWPDFLSPPDDGGDPGKDDEDGNCEEKDQDSRKACYRQRPCKNEWSPEEKSLRNGAPAA